MADEESIHADGTSCSIPSLQIDDSMSCSVPSLSVNDTLCSIPSLSIEHTTSLPTMLSVETTMSRETAAEASRSSSSTNDFVRNVEEEMLKVSIDKTNIDRTTEDYPTNQSNNVPHLHNRQEERAVSASHRLLSEADNKLLSSPLELPAYKDNSIFPRNSSSQEVSKKKVAVSTCGTQVQVKSKPETNERGVQAVVSKAAIDEKLVEKRVSFSSIIKTTEDDKSPKRLVVGKEDEPLYKVLTVSPKQSNKTTKNNNVSSNSNLELKSNTARSLLNTQHMQSTYQAFPTIESKPVTNKHNQVTSTRHTNFSSTYSFSSRKESSVLPSNQVSLQRFDGGNEIATQTNSIMKPIINTTHVTAPPEDNHEYNTKLASLGDELDCIRKLLDDTKSKSISRRPWSKHASANNRHVPSSIDLPENIEVQNDGPQLKLNNESTTPLSRTSTLTTIPFELQCTKTRLFPAKNNNNNRRRSTGKNNQSGSFSPTASFCGSGSVSVSGNESLSSVSFIKPKRRNSRQLLHPRSSLLGSSKKNNQSK